MIGKITNFIKAYFNDIMLFTIIVLLVLLSFAAGYIVAKNQSKEPIQIKQAKQT